MHANPTLNPGSRAAAAPPRQRLVTDAPTRMFHWLFALSFTGAYLSADSERWRLLHVTLGYTLAGLLVFRLLYGLLGPRQARLGLWWRKAASGLNGLRAQPLNLAQGPHLLMALAVLAMLVLVVPLTLSGWATFHDLGPGDALEELHEFFGNGFGLLVLLHLGLLLGLGLWRRKNTAGPMLSGRVPGPGPDLAKHNHAWLAALLLLAVLAYGAWEWRQSPHGLLPNPAAASRHLDDDD